MTIAATPDASPPMRLRILLTVLCVAFTQAFGLCFGQFPPMVPNRFRIRLPNALDELSGNGDLIDRHAPVADRSIVRNLEKAQDLIREGKWPDAIELLQFVIESPQDAYLVQANLAQRISDANQFVPILLPLSRLAIEAFLPVVIAPRVSLAEAAAAGTRFLPGRGPRGISIKRRAELLLRNMPEAGRRAYLNTYAQVAADLLTDAQQKNDFSKLCEVAKRYWNTPSGQTAADEIATLLADSGDDVSAAIWFSALLEDGDRLTRTAEWRRKAAQVWVRLGRVEESRRIEAGLPLESAPNIAALRKDVTTPDNPPRPDEDAASPAPSMGDRPLLLEAWSTPMAHRQDVQDQVRELQTDLQGNHAGIPAITAVTAGDYVAVRTLAGVEVRDASSGQLQWRNDERFTAEGLMAASSAAPGVNSAVGRLGPWDDPDLHPLTSLLYRDRVLGRLTTDGTQLFVVEQRLPLISNDYDFYMTAHPDGAAALRWDHSVNVIAAYEISSGRRLWSVGGPESDEVFAPPLSGVYFFGPPTPAGRELFVIGCTREDVNLYCLDASTGHPLWTQRIAQYDSLQIENDTVRQLWSCAPTVTAGLVICPTNCGWLTAVDRLRQTIAWSTRYSNRRVDDRYQPHYSLESVEMRWPAEPPILSQGTIIASPPELPDEGHETQPTLYGIDAITGRIHWRRQKGGAMAVAGVIDDAVITIGRDQIEAWPVEGGLSPRWVTPYPVDRTPCGLGVVADGCYWVPCEQGAILGFRLSDGKLETRLDNPETRARLGNLLRHRDRVLSVGVRETISFWQQEPLEQEIARLRQANSSSLAGRLLSARRYAGAQNWTAALEELQQAEWPEPETTLFREADDLRWKCLTSIVANDHTQHATEWNLLKQHAASEERRRLVDRLTVDRAVAQGNWNEAIDAAWRLIDARDAGPIVDGTLTASLETWLGGRLEEIWKTAPDDVRTNLDKRIQETLNRDEAADGSWELTDSVFAFHPAARLKVQNLAKAAVESGNFAEAEVRLRGLTQATKAEVQAQAYRELIAIWSEQQSLKDARKAAQALAALGSIEIEGGSTAETFANLWLSEHPPENDPPIIAAWPPGRCEVVRTGMEYGPGHSIDIYPTGEPAKWFATRRFAIESAWDGLAIVHESDGQREWLTPLPHSHGYEGEPMPVAIGDGSILLVYYRGVIHALSPIDRRELWSWNLPPRFSRPIEYSWSAEQLTTASTQSLEEMQTQFQTNGIFRREGPLMVASGGRLAVLGQRELVVLDLISGRELWRRSGLSPSAVLVVDKEAISVSETSINGKPAAYRLVDGRELPSDGFQEVLQKSVAVAGGRLLTMESTFGLFSRPIRVSSVHPQTGKADWKQVFPSGTQFGWGLENELVAVQSDGKIAVIDRVTGARSDLGQIPQKAINGASNFFAIVDHDRVYVVTNSTDYSGFSYLSLPSIPLHGQIFAFDRRTAKLAWSLAPGQNLNLVVSQFRRLPVLILAGYTQNELSSAPDSPYLHQVHLRLIDKSTGQESLKWLAPTIGGSPSVLTVDPANRRIDILSYNERYRLQFPESAANTATPPRAD